MRFSIFGRAAFVAASFALLSQTAHAADLTLNLATPKAGGTIAVAIYGDAEDFAASRNPVRTVVVPSAGVSTRTVIRGLAPGRYAVAVFHDVDGNGDLTLWPIGLPREAYGFSNNARGRFGPPAWTAAAFALTEAGAVQAVTLR